MLNQQIVDSEPVKWKGDAAQGEKDSEGHVCGEALKPHSGSNIDGYSTNNLAQRPKMLSDNHLKSFGIYCFILGIHTHSVVLLSQ